MCVKAGKPEAEGGVTNRKISGHSGGAEGTTAGDGRRQGWCTGGKTLGVPSA